MSAFTKTVVGTDATLLTAGGDYLASFKKLTLSLKKVTVDITGANDLSESTRVVRFGKGTASVSGFVRGTSAYATAFAAGGENLTLLFTEATGGDKYSLTITPIGFGKSTGEGATEDSQEFEVTSIPLFATGDGTLTAMTL
jgi:hypothetical protein